MKRAPLLCTVLLAACVGIDEETDSPDDSLNHLLVGQWGGYVFDVPPDTYSGALNFFPPLQFGADGSFEYRWHTRFYENGVMVRNVTREETVGTYHFGRDSALSISDLVCRAHREDLDSLVEVSCASLTGCVRGSEMRAGIDSASDAGSIWLVFRSLPDGPVCAYQGSYPQR